MAATGLLIEAAWNIVSVFTGAPVATSAIHVEARHQLADRQRAQVVRSRRGLLPLDRGHVVGGGATLRG
jgi:hypothetical protein